MLIFYKFLYKYCKNKQKFFSKLPSKYYPYFLKKIYKMIMKEDLNLDKPQTLSEKIQWLKLNESTKLKAYITDKITFKDWLKTKIGEGYSAKLFQTCENFEQINFDVLPEDGFVIKINNSFKKNIFLYKKTTATKYGMQQFKDLTEKWLKDKHAFNSFELHYKYIKPKLLVEELLCKRDDPNIPKYQFYCFNGEPKIIEQYVQFSKHKYSCCWHDLNWNRLPFSVYVKADEKEVPVPKFLSEMIRISKELSKEFKFVRVDFMCLPDKLYVLELTFTPYSGFISFEPRKYDKIYGEMLDLGLNN